MLATVPKSTSGSAFVEVRAVDGDAARRDLGTGRRRDGRDRGCCRRGVGELVDLRDPGQARRTTRCRDGDGHRVGRGAGRVGGRVRRELAVPFDVHMGGGDATEVHRGRRGGAEVVALDGDGRTGGRVRRRRRQHLHDVGGLRRRRREQRRRVQGVDEGVSRVALNAKIWAYRPVAVSPTPSRGLPEIAFQAPRMLLRWPQQSVPVGVVHSKLVPP